MGGLGGGGGIRGSPEKMLETDKMFGLLALLFCKIGVGAGGGTPGPTPRSAIGSEGKVEREEEIYQPLQKEMGAKGLPSPTAFHPLANFLLAAPNYLKI